MIEFMHTWVFLALPLPVLAYFVLPPLAANAALPVPATIRNLIVGLSEQSAVHRQGLPDDIWLKAIGWVLIVTALAGPHTREEDLLTPTGRDLMIAVDLSASMDEPDMLMDDKAVPRYIVVRKLLGDFIKARKGDRIGLIAYGHEAYLVSPLTYDVNAVEAVLNELIIGLPGHRTDLGRAIGLAVKTFDPEQAESRVLVLLSDGEDNSGELTGIDAADLAGTRDIRIHTIGFSSNIESDGADVLKEIASSTGGRFFWAKTSDDLGTTSGEINRMEPVVRPDEEDQIIRDLSIFVILAALAVMAALVIREVRRA